ncbi:ARIH1 [Mytilus edulis]|uniref:RBR-type E3 ubiquitin transferase n=1 Tax=Mytilus edulis TaxID=6550 RepID=A0A8S3VLJ9_MYTED|nr:ARIH1 [Mytilus edulis]
MFDYYNGCVEDILHRAVTFLDMMSTDGFIENEKVPSKECMSSMKFENLNNCQKIKKDVSFVTRKTLFKDIFNNSLSDNETVVELGYECISSEYCGICFDFIAEGGKPGTALSSCGHWFCDECWIDHSRSRMNMGSVNITCPEHGCKETVADAVLLTFINVFEVLSLKRRHHDLKLQASDAKWCPNPNCCRVITVTNPEKAKDVACICGTHICFQCLQPPHWPVPCDKARAYWKKLKLNGDDIAISATFVDVRGKSCPKYVEEKIKELLNNMVSVYVELHHMAEYCYVFIDKLIKSGIKCSQLRENVDMLGYLADRVFNILTDSGDVKDCRPLLSSLLQIQQNAVDITKNVFAFTKKYIV